MTGTRDDSLTRWWQPLQRGDRRAISLMIVVPVLLFVVPALLGHPAIDADNLIQNFPLRVLSGRQIATGHLPLLNPYANSGTPLLGGLNAGALYPLTVIFAVMTPVAAWVLNLIAVYVTAAMGMYCLLRWHGLRTVASLAAAMSFTYTGAMIGQIVHLGVVQGFALIPWTVLILLSLSRRLRDNERPSRWLHTARVVLPSILAYALVWGLTFLSGEPRAIAEIELVTLVVAPLVLVLRSSYWLTNWRARVWYAGSLAVGLAWGLGIGLVQLLPGWSFIGFSQRSTITYQFFGAGSLAVRWTSLLFVQDMFGGNGALGQPGYFTNYNLPEVTGYAGVLALVATAAFLTRLTRRGWKGAHRDYALYVALAAVGLFATWGSFTPLGHLFRAIPLFGSTRLQSRSIIVVDFAASVLLGWWLDRVCSRDYADAGLAGRSRWLTCSPAAAVVALCVALLGWGTGIVHFLGTGARSSHLVRRMWPALSLHLLVAVATITTLWFLYRSKWVVRWLLGILAADVILFLAFCGTGLVGGNNDVMPSRAGAISQLGNVGRTALVDLGGAHYYQYQALGLPNMNVFTKLPSVQGYGSLISTIYNDYTDTHPMTMIDPCHMARGTFTQLRLSAVAIASNALSADARFSTVPTTTCLRTSATAITTRRYFGQSLAVRSITLVGPYGHPVSSEPVTVQLLDGSGRPVGEPMTLNGYVPLTFDFQAFHLTAAGFVVSSLADIHVADAVVSQRDRAAPSYRLDTPFQLALSTTSWHLSSTHGTYSVFQATHLRPPAWLAAPSSYGRVTAIRYAPWGDSWVSVSANARVVLRRSMSYIPGWRATALNETTGRSVPLAVNRSGLIQKVTVPKGKWTIHFHYHAPYIEASFLTSIVSDVAWWAGIAYLAGSVLRRRRGRV